MDARSAARPRVVLIEPHVSARERKLMPPLGLMYLASFIREICDVRILDLSLKGAGPDEAASLCLDLEPDIVGISSLILNYSPALEISDRIKEQMPSTRIVLGGPHPSGLAGVTGYPQEHDVPADVVAFGEGEVTMHELVDRYPNWNADIAGTIIRTGDVWQRNGPRPLIDDLDGLPFPAWNLITPEPYYEQLRFKRRRFAPMMTSRGCPHHCSFCPHAVFGHRIRMRSPTNVLDEVRMLTDNLAIEELIINDENFTHDRERALSILRMLKNEDLALRFDNGLRVDTLDEELIAALADAGAYYTGLGIESGAPVVQARNRKNIDLVHAQKVVRLCQDHGILTKAFMIVGLPGETRSTLERTQRFIEELDADLIVLGFFFPVPSTPAFDEACVSGTFSDTYPFDGKVRVNWVPPGLDEDFLEKYMATTYLSFYNPFRLARTMGRIVTHASTRELASLVSDGLHLAKRGA